LVSSIVVILVEDLAFPCGVHANHDAHQGQSPYAQKKCNCKLDIKSHFLRKNLRKKILAQKFKATFSLFLKLFLGLFDNIFW